MYDLYFHKSPNTYKVAILFEALGLEYRTHFVNVGASEQFAPEFIAISPNSKVPVIRDPQPADGGPPLIVFESNAILFYVARKERRLLPVSSREHEMMMQWLFWQAAGQGPMFGQSAHFTLFANHIEYAKSRYNREAKRLCGVLDRHLGLHEFVAGTTYTIADIACYPWMTDKALACIGVDSLEAFPHLSRWRERMTHRSEVAAGIGRLDRDEKPGPPLDQFAMSMFGLSPELAKAAAQRAGATLASLGVQFEERRNDLSEPRP